MKKKVNTRSILQDADPAVRSYLSSLGFSLPVSSERFTRDIESRFGRAGQDVLRALDQRADENCPDHDFYPLKNSTLPLSLAVTLWRKGGFYASFLSWLQREDLPNPSRILDIGCDNGVLTCFYAQQFPDAEVIGIDLHESSIDRAKELAAKLAVQNASFQVLDLSRPSLPMNGGLTAEAPFHGVKARMDCALNVPISIDRAEQAFLGSTFDLVTATHVLDPDLESCRHISSLTEVEQLEIASEDLDILARIRRLTTPSSGILLTTNAFDDRAVGFWTRIVSHAGFSINWARSSIVYWPDSDDEQETCPVLVAENKERPDCWTLDDVLAFCSFPELVEKAENLTFSDSAAEAMFRGCNPKKLAKGAKVTGPEGDVHHIQLWTCGPLAFTYQYSSGNLSKSLSLFSTTGVAELLRQMDQALADVPTGSRVELYDSPER